MWNNYWSILYRTLLKSKGFTAINILGLAIGLACCLIIYLFVLDELSYDRFHSKAERIYRVAFSTDDSQLMTNANGSWAAAPAMAADFPEVEAFTRFRKMGQGTKIMVGRGDRRFYEERFFFADSTAFQIFDFPLAEGNPVTVLTDPNTVVISESMAAKYFETENPLGKILLADPYNSGEPLQLMVTGVMKDVPTSSHIKFDFLASFSSQKENLSNWFGFQQIFSYVLLNENASAGELAEKLKGYANRYMGENAWYQVALQPLLDIRLHSHLRSETETNGSPAILLTFGGIGLIILIIASINFMTLSTARAARRAREVGVRKSLGAHRGQLFWQFINEAFLFTLLSMLLAFVMAEFTLPWLNSFAGKSISIVTSLNAPLILFAGALLVFITFFAGSYPAVFLSAYQPGLVLKGGGVKRKSLDHFRKALVIFQFAISIGLIAATLIVRQQLDFARNQTAIESGDQVLIAVLNKQAGEKYNYLKTELMQQAGVAAVAGSSIVPSMGSDTWAFEIGPEKKVLYPYTYLADAGITETFGYKLLNGRSFHTVLGPDSIFDAVISETSLAELGITDPEEALGQVFDIADGFKGRMVGVMQDFHVYSMKEKIKSAIFIHAPTEYYEYVSVRIKAQNIQKVVEKLEGMWPRLSPDYPLEYFFLDEGYQRLHESENKLASLFSIFSTLAIVIACLGLFGLASYETEQRTKEIGIRKVMGADVTQIVWLLTKEFGKLVLIAIIITIPAVWYAMSKWLEDFVYRTTIGWQVFFLAGIAGLLIAYLTVSWQSAKAARSNPVKSLRYE